MSDLDFTTTEDLLEELAKRFDHAAFVGLQVLSDDEDGEQKLFRRWLGNTHTVTGLMEDAKLTMLQEYHERSEDAE